MVTGIESFKEWFKGSEEQYAIIGWRGGVILYALTGV